MEVWHALMRWESNKCCFPNAVTVVTNHKKHICHNESMHKDNDIN